MITIFTPTYNRANLLPKVYKSLCNQTYSDFEWIVVDDGSIDNTTQVINNFSTSTFPIRYFKKRNGGKHSAINFGVKKAKGELFFIVDSDDCLPENALQIITQEYTNISNDNNFAGIAGLDCYKNGRIIGSGLPKETINCNAIDIRYKYGVQGDLKEVFRTQVLIDYPFPEFEGETFCPEQLVWFRIAQKYKLRYFNHPIYIVEYQENGITSSITKARMSSPIATMMCYKEMSEYKNIAWYLKIKGGINYWRFRFCNNKSHDFPKLKWFLNWTMPLGYILHLIDKKRT